MSNYSVVGPTPEKMVKAFLSFLLCVLLSAAASAASISHFGATDPATEGWQNTLGVAGYAGDDCWVTDTYGYAKWQPVGTDWHAFFADDWSLTVEAQWVSGPAGQLRTTIFDGLRGKSGAFTWDADNAYFYYGGLGDTVLPGIDPTVYNTYEVLYHGDTSIMDIVVNDTLIDSLNWSEQNDIAVGSYLLYWGDNNGGNFRSTMNWREVTFRDHIIPEPSTWVLLVLAFVCIYFWRRVQK